MRKKSIENSGVTGFTWLMLADCRPLPMALLRAYRNWGLDESELILLLRVISPVFRQGYASLDEVAAEFGISAAEVTAVTEPFLSRRLLEYDAQSERFTCERLLNDIYEDWVIACRTEKAASKTAARPISRVGDSKESVRRISKLYRLVEQHFGRPLRYTESDKLRSWLDDELIDPDLIEEAARRASLADKCTFNYVGAILRKWQSAGFTTLVQVQESDKKPSEKPAPKREKKGPKKSKFEEVADNVLEKQQLEG